LRAQAGISSQTKIETILRRLSQIAAIFAILVGLLVLLAWKFAIVGIITAGSGHNGMARGTALALLLSGASLLALVSARSNRWLKRLAIGGGWLTIVIAAPALLRLVGPPYLDDNLLFGPLPAGERFLTVQMAPNTALCLILVGLALLLLKLRIGRWCPSQWCALLAATISLAACVGYAYDVRGLYGIPGYTQMAVHTAATLLILSLGVLFAQPRAELMIVLSQDGPIGTLVRRLFPAAIAAPIISGWLALKGHQAGWYSTEAGIVLYATLNVIFLLSFLYLAMTSRAVAEEKFRGLLESAPETMVIVNRMGKIVLANAQTEKLFGYACEELLGQPVEILVPERFRGKHVADRTQFSISPQARPMGSGLQLYGRHKDGLEFPVEISLAAMQSDEGMLISSTIRDITERKRVEQTLRESEERFRVALKGAPVVVFNQDRELRYTWINSPVLTWAEQGYLGRTDADLVGGEEGARLTAIKHGVLQSGVGTRVETIVTYRDEPHYFDLTVEPLRDVAGDIVGITCAAVDITPIKQGAQERERLIRELQEALAQVKVLSGLLPICASCKKIRDEQGQWNPVEKYIRDRSDVSFSHGICPECARRLYPEFCEK
jgi:PAS domain S-box-containing protein